MVNKYFKHIIAAIITVTSLNAEVIYVTNGTLGYHIAQKIIKKMPNAQAYQYDSECMREAKKAIRMGVNLRISKVHRACVQYIKNRDLSAPRKYDAGHIVKSLMD